MSDAGGKGAATVLVVDDEESFHKATAKHLAAHDVVRAYNGRQALEALDGQPIDVVLLDLELPDSNGLTLLGRISADYPELPVIVVSAHNSRQHTEWAAKAGALRFISKTYEDYQRLPEVIANALQHSEKRRAVIAEHSDPWLEDAEVVLENVVRIASGGDRHVGPLDIDRTTARLRGIARRAAVARPLPPDHRLRLNAIQDRFERLIMRLAASRYPTRRAAARALGVSTSKLWRALKDEP